MLLNALIVIGLILVGLIVLIAARPAGFRLTRSATVSASPAAVFAEVNDFHRWEHWSPWAKLDPAMQTTLEGPPAGVGAIYSWTGNSKVGAGRMTLTESRPGELIRICLEFLKPFAATNTTEFTFQASGDRTLVTWSMAGRNNFLAKAFGLFVNVERMVGADFEKGLAQLRTLVETRAGGDAG